VVAVLCLFAAVAVFIADFDRMTGRTGGDTGSQARSAKSEEATSVDATTETAEPTDGADAAQVVAEVSAMMDEGRYDEARVLLAPLLDIAEPDPAVVELSTQLEASAARHTALVQRIDAQKAGKRWSGVIESINQLEELHPIDAAFQQLRVTAGVERAHARATALMKLGRLTAAATVVDAALKQGPSPKLERLRAEIRAKYSATSTPATVPATTMSGGGAHSGGTHPTSPPTPGGRPASTTGARPPANVPAGALPPRPDAPNPGATGGGSPTGQPATTGNGAAAGTAMVCPAAARTTRHAGEQHTC